MHKIGGCVLVISEPQGRLVQFNKRNEVVVAVIPLVKAKKATNSLNLLTWTNIYGNNGEQC